MFNLLDGKSEEDGRSDEATSLQNMSDSSLTDKVNLNSKDWRELDNILTIWVKGIQQDEYLLQDAQVNNTLNSEINPTFVTGVNPLHIPEGSAAQVNEVSKTANVGTEIPMFLSESMLENKFAAKNPFIHPKREDESFSRGNTPENEAVPLDFSELEQELAKLIREIKPFEGTRQVKGESPNLHITTDVRNGLVQSLQEVEGITQSTSPEPSTLESSVKTVMDNNFSLPNITIQQEKNMDQTAPINVGEEGTKTIDQPFMGTNQVKGSDATVISKAIPAPPVLTFTSFVPEVSEWMGRFMKISNNPLGSTEARFSLYPEHLGHVEIKISSQEGQVSAQIITDTSLAKETLEGQLQQLRQALQQHGITVQKLEIVQQLPATLDSNQSNPAFSQSGSGSTHDHRTTNSGKDGSKKENEADEIEVGREVIPAPALYGKPTFKTASRIDFTA